MIIRIRFISIFQHPTSSSSIITKNLIHIGIASTCFESMSKQTAIKRALPGIYSWMENRILVSVKGN